MPLPSSEEVLYQICLHRTCLGPGEGKPRHYISGRNQQDLILSMDKQAKQLEILQRLHGLAGQPGTQVHCALELLDQERGNQVVSADLDIVTAAAIPEARPVLLRLYDYYDAACLRHDLDKILTFQAL